MKKTTLAVLATIIVLSLFVTPTFAEGKSPGQRFCETTLKGYWDPITKVCLGTKRPWNPSNWCGGGHDYDQFIVWMSPSSLYGFGTIWNTQCVSQNPDPNVSAGVPLDVSSGACGAYIASPPVAGSAYVYKYGGDASLRAWAHGGEFVKGPCALRYIDAEGNDIDGFGSLAYVYFNLDAATHELYRSGRLTLVVNDGTNWIDCGPTFSEYGDHGRLSCMSPYDHWALVKP
jgi:hypothetical protein